MRNWIIGLIVILMLPVVVYGEDDATRARTLFETGNQLFSEENYEAAAKQFRKAYALKPSYKILFNLGQSEAAAKRHGAALEAFEKYLSMGGDEILESRAAEVHAEIKRLRNLSGILAVKGPDGMAIRVDGTVRGELPTTRRIWLAAGVVHHIQGEFEDQVVEKSITILGGDTMSLNMGVSTETPAVADVSETSDKTDEPIPETVDESPGRGKLIAGLSLLGVGAAALVGGAITGGLTLNKESLLKSKCPENSCTADQRDIKESRDRLAVTNMVLLATGGAIAVGGVVLVVLSRVGKSEKQVSLVPTLGGLSLKGSF